MTRIYGGEIITRMLAAEGVEKVFGIIDGTYYGLYGTFRRYGIEQITPRHEAVAAHMAGAYSRMTGRLGVCMASNGPGVANMLTGVAVEEAEGHRVLLITSSRRTGIMYPDRGGAYQSFDQVGVIGKMSKWSASAQSYARIPELMRQALRMCFTGRPGVVHLDVPEDLMNGETDAPALMAPEQYRRTNPIWPDPEMVSRAADLLVEAKLPCIHAGTGVIHAGAYEELAAVAALLNAPITTSWSGRGAVDETSDLSIPMIHIELTDRVRNEADLVLSLGSRMGETDWWGKQPNWRAPAEQKMIQVDIDDQWLGRNKPVTLAVLADIKVFLRELHGALEKRDVAVPVAERAKKIAVYAEQKAAARASLDEALKNTAAPMTTAHLGPACRRALPADSIAVFCGGNTNVWANFYHEMRVPNSMIWTYKMGMLGAGLGQALGAAVAHPSRQVYCIIGDGAMGFHPQELETAVRHDLPVIFLVACDRQWGMVKATQQISIDPLKAILSKSLPPEQCISTDLGEIRWDKLAESMGAYGERVADPKDLEPALRRCREVGRCSVLHVDVDPVNHLWAPGLIHFKKMHAEPVGG